MPKPSKISDLTISCPTVSFLLTHENHLSYQITSRTIEIRVVLPNNIPQQEPSLLITAVQTHAELRYYPHPSLPTLSSQTPPFTTLAINATNFKFDSPLPVEPKLPTSTPVDQNLDVQQQNLDQKDAAESISVTLTVSAEEVTMYEDVQDPTDQDENNNDEFITFTNTPQHEAEEQNEIFQQPENTTTLVKSYLTNVQVTKTAKRQQITTDPIQISQVIDVETNGPSVQATYSIVLHWTFFSAITRTNEMIRRFKHTLNPPAENAPIKKKKKPITDVHVRFNDAIINAHLIAGKSSTMDVQTKHVTIDVRDDFAGQWKKTDVHFVAGYTTSQIDDDSEINVVQADGVEFHNIVLAPEMLQR
mmetsp:Transcript_9756/g.14243  ORF Transcript_9756/g.14243 Transcript_9756/m.14243 type:complete len:361 (-) Transcript_9756:219-1301(-)